MTAREVADIIEAWAPLSTQELWDNGGFCVGHPQTEVKGVLLCLDVTLSVLDEAVDIGANMIISHHPLVFEGIKQISGQNEVARLVVKAIKSDLVIYSAHTNADKAETGVSRIMADKLCLQNIKPLSHEGFGVVGDLPNLEEVCSFLQKVKELFNISHLRVGPIYVPMIGRVALCGGSGSSHIKEAIEKGADIYLCGDIGYHHFFSTDRKMNIVDMGHFESEIDILTKFDHLLSEKNLTFAVSITKNNTNPIHFF